jgi:hypothetical protein
MFSIPPPSTLDGFLKQMEETLNRIVIDSSGSNHATNSGRFLNLCKMVRNFSFNERQKITYSNLVTQFRMASKYKDVMFDNTDLLSLPLITNADEN